MSNKGILHLYGAVALLIAGQLFVFGPIRKQAVNMNACVEYYRSYYNYNTGEEKTAEAVMTCQK